MLLVRRVEAAFGKEGLVDIIGANADAFHRDDPVDSPDDPVAASPVRRAHGAIGLFDPRDGVELAGMTAGDRLQYGLCLVR